MGASAGEEALPTSIFLPRSVFVLYNVYPSEGEKEVQILVNFSTLMDFLECALVNIIQEDSVYPLHIVLDTWLYVRYVPSTHPSIYHASSLLPLLLLPTSIPHHSLPSFFSPSFIFL